jgi:hypothetical protein
MKKTAGWILSAILLLAVFCIFLLGCDWLSCDQEDTYVSSPEECEQYCSADPGCSLYIYIAGACSCE